MPAAAVLPRFKRWRIPQTGVLSDSRSGLLPGAAVTGSPPPEVVVTQTIPGRKLAAAQEKTYTFDHVRADHR